MGECPFRPRLRLFQPSQFKQGLITIQRAGRLQNGRERLDRLVPLTLEQVGVGETLLHQPGHGWIRTVECQITLIGLDRRAHVIGLDQRISQMIQREWRCGGSRILIDHLPIPRNRFLQRLIHLLRIVHGRIGQEAHRLTFELLRFLRGLAVHIEDPSHHGSRKQQYAQTDQQGASIIL